MNEFTVWDHVFLGGGVFATISFRLPTEPVRVVSYNVWEVNPGEFKVECSEFPTGTGFDTLPGVYRYMADMMEASM